MPVINSNIVSLATQNNVYKSKSGVATAIVRLASGLRINSAKDDSAGQGIANRFTTQIRGFSQVVRNLSDGISLAQTTEGATASINENVQRIRELTVQAKNGTNSQKDLNSIQAEVRQRLDDIDRIAEQTQFNGKKVLNGSGNLNLQAGVNDNEQINLTTREMSTDSLGIHYFYVNKIKNARELNQSDVAQLTGSSSIPPSSVYIDDSSKTSALTAYATSVGLSSDAITSDGKIYRSDQGDFYMKVEVAQPIVSPNDQRFKEQRLETNTTPETVFYVQLSGAQHRGNGVFHAPTIEPNKLIAGYQKTVVETTNPGVTNPGLTPPGEPLISDRAPISYFQTRYPFIDVSQLIANGVDMPQVGISYQFDDLFNLFNIPGAPPNAFNGEDFTVRYSQGRLLIKAVGGSNAAAIGFSPGQNLYIDVTDKLTDNSYFAVYPYFGVTIRRSVADSLLSLDELFTIDESVGVVPPPQPPVTTITKSSVEVDEMLLQKLDLSLDQIDSFRGELGAVMNRLESAIDSVSVTKISLEAARSRIEDADYAVEVSNLSKNQILQQAGTSALSQANQIPQITLQLLR